MQGTRYKAGTNKKYALYICGLPCCFASEVRPGSGGGCALVEVPIPEGKPLSTPGKHQQTHIPGRLVDRLLTAVCSITKIPALQSRTKYTGIPSPRTKVAVSALVFLCQWDYGYASTMLRTLSSHSKFHTATITACLRGEDDRAAIK